LLANAKLDSCFYIPHLSSLEHPAKVWDLIQDYYVGDVKPEEHVKYTFKQQSKL
jgi:hypothetical protein